jgi:single-stranded-DNA-specific exonuclease
VEKKWVVKHDCRGMETSEIIDTILVDRGVEDAMALLYPNEDCLIPFEKMKNIDRAAQVILDGIENDKKFLVYGDVDVDGCSSNAIAVRWLRGHGARVDCCINQGKEHGIAKADQSLFVDVDILWIVDSIETQMYPYENALKAGVEEIVITDHHLVSKSIQKQMERTGHITLVSSAVDYPNPAASGSIVTWKLCSYMDWLELDDISESLYDLAATGAVADMVDVGVESPENRYICYRGFNNQVNPALKKINGSYEFNSQAVSFGIAPLVNSANRVNENEKAMNLFLTDDTKAINSLVNELKFCKESQNIEIAEIMPELELQAESQMDKKVMFFFAETENEVAGLVANKLLEKFSRPVFVLKNRITVNEETGEVEKHEYTGSCRAVGVKNFKEYVDKTSLVGCAGHELAFGVWMDSEVLEDFQNALEDALKDVQFIQETTVDIQIDQEQITDDLIRQLKMLNRISGQGWPSISVMVSGIADYEVGQMSGGKHLKLIADEGKLLYIKWNFSGDRDQFDGPVSAIGTLDSGFFGRTYYRQLIMNDFVVDKLEDL